MTISQTFCVQDRTGTCAQLTLDESTIHPVAINDTGRYSGFKWDGTVVSYDFTVNAVPDPLSFCISTMTSTGAPGNVLASGWPKQGTVTWLTGANSTASPLTSVISDMNPANAYVDVDYFTLYHTSRGNAFPGSPVESVQHAIVMASDYIDQKYRFKGIKLMQLLSSDNIDPFLPYIDPWLSPFGFNEGIAPSIYEPSTTAQQTEWPRQGVVDYSGDSVYGVPLVVKQAASELGLRVLNGTILQPDYDPNIVTAGGVLGTLSEEVGPIKITSTYDTKLGLGFFPDFPQVTRMLQKAGLIIAGGGRRIIR